MLSLTKKNLIPLAIIVAGVIIAGTVIYTNSWPFSKEGDGRNIFLSSQEAAEKAIKFINENILQEGMTASLTQVGEENGLYKIKLKIGDNEFDSYVSKDGKILFPEFISLDEAEVNQPEEEAVEGQKTDRPDVKLFVMSYCPYGLQAQKMFLPVYDLLKDKADMAVYFVDYIMHGKDEIDENLRQYCIQKEQGEKYGDYLKCFVQDGDFEKCLASAKIEKAKFDSCVGETDKKYKITEQYNDQATWLNGQFPKFDVHTDLNEKYGVMGSPTIVINGAVVNVSQRSPEAFKETVCQAFTEQPESCFQALSDEAFSPGFGGSVGSSSGGQCK